MTALKGLATIGGEIEGMSIRMEGIFLWLAIGVYFISLVSFMGKAIFGRETWERRGFLLLGLGFLLQSTTIISRWLLIGHPPVMGGYENALAGSWCAGLVYLVGERITKGKLRPLGIVLGPVVLLMLGFGLTAEKGLQPLAPPYQSNWLWVHVGFAWLAWGSFLTAAGLGLIYLVKSARAQAKEGLGLEEIEGIIPRAILFGFIAQGLMVVSGALWAHKLWGSYWSWDPVETWSLISWILYGLILHLHLTLGWKGKRLAWAVVLAIISPIIYFWGVGFIAGIHTPLIR